MKFVIMSKTVTTLLMLIPLATAAFAAEPVRLTSSEGNDTEAQFSPDGKTIVFQSDRSGTLDLYTVDATSDEPQPLLTAPGHASFPTYSPDGQSIVYAYAHFTRTALEGHDHGYNLFVIPADGDGTPRQLTSGLYRDYSPVFGPDGQTVYFSSTRLARDLSAIAIYKVPLAGGEPALARQIAGHTVQPSFSPDGRFVAYGALRGVDDLWTVRISKRRLRGDLSERLLDGERRLWDLSADFTLEANPNGAWSYGYVPHDRNHPLDTTDTAPLPKSAEQHKQGPLDVWYHPQAAPGSYADLPTIGSSPGGGRSGNFVYSAGECAMHPGGPFRGGTVGVTAVLRWTAPRDGDVVATGLFRGIGGGDRDLHVVRNKTEILTGQYSLNATELPFRHEVSVRAGDTIDVCVGRGTMLPSSEARIDATIHYAGHAPPRMDGVYLPPTRNADRTLSDDGRESYYAPRWSPVGWQIACTGYRADDEGWNVYVIDTKSGEKRCVTAKQRGNSRSPAWSPDGNSLVYENNQTGTYQLYRVEL